MIVSKYVAQPGSVCTVEVKILLYMSKALLHLSDKNISMYLQFQACIIVACL